VTLRGEDGEQRTIALAELRTEAEEVGAPLPATVAHTPPPGDAVADSGEDDLESAEERRTVVAEAPEGTAAAGEEQHERRPHRRRGRRGGRRNRAGSRGANDAAPEASSDSPESTASSANSERGESGGEPASED